MEGVLVPLALLACPVGMGVMMWFMNRGMKEKAGRPDAGEPSSLDELRREHARLGADIERLEGGRAPNGEPVPR